MKVTKLIVNVATIIETPSFAVDDYGSSLKEALRPLDKVLPWHSCPARLLKVEGGQPPGKTAVLARARTVIA